MSQNNVKYNRATAPAKSVEHKRAAGRFRTRNNRPSTLGERALQTEPNAHHGNVEVVGEHQRSYHRQLCLQTRSPLPSSSPPKRTNRVTRPDTATLTPTRRRFQHLRKTQAPRRAGFGPTRGTAGTTQHTSQTRRLTDRVGQNTRTHRRAGTRDNPSSGHAARQAADFV